MGTLFELKVPHLGEGIHHVRVANILAKAGDTVEEDDDIIEIETDKATYEVPSPVSGCIANILCQKGQILNVGENLLVIEEGKTIQTAVNSNLLKQKRKGSVLRQQIEQKPSANENKLSEKQKILTERLYESDQIIIPATLEKTLNWDLISNIRKNWALKLGAPNKPSSLDVVAYAVSQAMFEFKKFRSKLSRDLIIEENQEALIGIAVSIEEDELVTPTVNITKDTDLPDLSANIKKTVNDVRQGIEKKGSYHSISISDMSAFGITKGNPVVVFPAVATLLIGAPFYMTDDKKTSHKVCTITLGFDHRLINGVYAAKFLKKIEKTIKKMHKESNYVGISGKDK